jgi:hypothetical protein
MKNIFLFTLLTFAYSANAADLAALGSCYSAKLPDPNSAHVDTELFVVVDQTTLFDVALKQSIANNIRPFIRAGNALSVIQFSAFTQGHYTDILATTRLDGLLTQEQRNAVSKPVLAKFDQCVSNEPAQASRIIGEALKSVFINSSNGIEKSDVEASLKDISSKVARSQAKRKLVLIASDMLENSSISSFYAKQAVRQIDPAAEMSLVNQNGMLGDFAGAEVFVIGAGLLAQDATQAKGVYRSPQVMNALKSFWSDWFRKSNATLVDFGQPALLNPLK